MSSNSSSRSVSNSAKTVRGSGNTRSTGNSSRNNSSNGQQSSNSNSMHQSIDRFRAIYQHNCNSSTNSNTNNHMSMRSIISDLDLESAEMAPIGEGTCSYETDMKRIAGLGPQHKTEQQSTDCTSSEFFPSADFTLASGNSCNGNGIQNYKDTGGAANSKHSDPPSQSLNSQNNRGSSNGDNFSFASHSVMLDRSRAENVGRSGTKFVYIVLLITGTILSTLIFVLARGVEHRNFELEFRSFARETADLAETNADHTFSQLQTLATAVTSEGMLGRDQIHMNMNMNMDQDNNDNERYHDQSNSHSSLVGTWPNVTIPHFDQRIEDFSESFGAVFLSYVPLVQAKDKDQWEYYANQHEPWKTAYTSHYDIDADPNSLVAPNTSLDDESALMHEHEDGELAHDNNVTTYGNTNGFLHIHPCLHLDADDAREGLADVDTFMDSVLMNEGGFEDPRNISAPIYQYGGPGHRRTQNSAIALMDLWSHPIFKKEVIASIEYNVPVISEYLDVGFLRDALSTMDPNGNAASLWDSEYAVYSTEESNSDDDTGKSANLSLPAIRSLTLHPVKETFEPDARTIGFVVGVVPWHTFFRNIFKTSKVLGNSTDVVYEEREVNGIVVKVESDCGSVFTFVLNSRDGTTKARLGDWKEQYEKYEHLNHSSRFFWKDHPKGQSRHCHFDLHIYPNDEFRDAYKVGNDWRYASIVAGIFFFTGLLFACYERLIFKGQQEIVSQATGMIVENARRAAKNERELNDFIAHEVRNPLAAAISACSFVSSAIMEDQGRYNSSSDINISNYEGTDTERLALIASNEKRKEVQQDVDIIDSSLHFINDLLRNMLDMQRAGSNQIYIERKPTDIMNDIFRPVEAMMHLRDAPFTVTMEVDSGLKSGDDGDDEQLVVMTDSMRLKQVLLNLTRNATKFVEKGFIRCSANVNSTNGLVELRVDDSGPGIPPEKRSQVFGKFQQSLDSLQQGTGIGLSLCKKMIDLMGGSLFIDDDYNSGIEGCPGTSFVIQLKIQPLQLNKMILEPQMSSHDRARLRRRHLMLTSESPSPEQPLSNKNQTDSANFSLSSASKDIALYLDSEMDCRLQEPVATLTEVTTGVGEAQVEEEDKKQGSKIVPPPTVLQLNDSPDAIDDQKEQLDGLVTELPKNLSVLFVDDDMVLRKLFSRTLRKVNPTWSCMEASSGESAIDLISQRAADSQEKSEDEDEFNRRNEDGDCGFDLIFMDQYMASVQKQLLGTETVRAIRAKGFRTPIICGLSANDVGVAFDHAGSDAFLIKPFPCKKDELKKELLKVVNSRVNKRNRKRNS